MTNRIVHPVDNATDQIYIPDWDSNGNPTYICRSAPGTATSEAAWQIKKITWSGSSPTNIQWASGSPAYNFIADNRASYSYS